MRVLKNRNLYRMIKNDGLMVIYILFSLTFLHPLFSQIWIHHLFNNNKSELLFKLGYYSIVILFLLLGVGILIKNLSFSLKSLNKDLKILLFSVFLLCAVVAISNIFSKIDSISRKWILFFFLGPLIYSLLLFARFDNKEVRKSIILMMLLNFIILFPTLVIYFKQILYYNDWFTKPFGLQHPNYEAMYVSCLIPLNLALIKTAGQKIERVFYWLNLLFLSFLVIILRSRGAYLALIVVIPFFVMKIYSLSYRAILLAFLIIGGSLLFAFSWPPATHFFRLQKADILSMNERLNMWKTSIRLSSENPILGIGWGGFRKLSPSVCGLSSRYSTPHNQFLTFLVETGIFGFLLFVGFVLFGIFRYIKISPIFPKNSEGFFIFNSIFYAVLILIITLIFEARLDSISFNSLFFVMMGLLSRSFNHELTK